MKLFKARRSLIVLSSFSAKTAFSVVQRLSILTMLSFKEISKNVSDQFFPSSVSLKFGFVFSELRMFSKKAFIVLAFYIFNGTLESNLGKVLVTTKIYIELPLVLLHSCSIQFNPCSKFLS